MNMRNKRLGIIVLAAFISLYGGAYAQDNDTEILSQDNEQIIKVKPNKETLNKAQEAINNKDFQTAITLMTSYINSKPQKFEPYKIRGDAYYALRRYDLAQKDYQTAVDIKKQDDKMSTSTKYISAIILGADKNEQLQNAELGDLYGALMYAQKAQNNPDYLTSYENAVKYNSHIYLPEPKKQDINKINCPQKYGRPLNPNGIDENIYGAIEDISKENYNEALYKLQTVTTQYPNYYLGHYLSGIALAGLEKDEDAIKSFNTAIRLNPYDFESYASLGQLYYSKAETTFNEEYSKQSIEYFNKALSLNKNCPTYYFYIGMNELQRGEINAAISYFNKALKLNEYDYNSMYYKLIAQYINGYYQDVIDGSTKLIYRHVSNYNSVLYLRALAYVKLNETDKAVQDLDTIESNINDIYNTDIKTTGEREKTLISYVHYLRSEIQHSLGEGAISDKAQSYNNPVINRLANAKKALEPYNKLLSKESISPADYKKFESFYSYSLPKLLESGAVITYNDIDNQYDYIRTTFDDLGISFVYTPPYYKITTIKDYPSKKFASKLNKDVINNESAALQADKAEPVIDLKQSTPQSEMITNADEPSLARMLAGNSLAEQAKAWNNSVNAPIVAAQEQNIPEDSQNSQFIPEAPDGERVNSSKNIASGGQYTGTPLVDDKNSQNVKNILDQEKTMSENPISTKEANKAETGNPQKTSSPAVETAKETKGGTVKISAKEIKETPDFVIRHEKTQPAETASSIQAKEVKTLVPETVTAGTAAAGIGEVSEKLTSKNTQKIQTDKKILNTEPDEKSITEPEAANNSTNKIIQQKYANVNPKDFGVQNKPLTVNNPNEIIELNTENISKKYNTDSDLFKKDENGNTVANIPDIFDDMQKQSQIISDSEIKDITKPVTLPEEKPQIIVKKETPIETPVVSVPKIRDENLLNPATDKETDTSSQAISKELQTMGEDLRINVPGLNSTEIQKDLTVKAQETIEETKPAQVSDSEISSTSPQPDKLTQSINKAQSLKEEKQRLKEQAKLAKQEVREEKQKAKEAQKLAKAQAEEEALKQKEIEKAHEQEIKENKQFIKTQEQNAAKDREGLEKSALAIKEQELKTAKEEDKLSEETDDLKVQRIIEKQKANEPELTKEQEKALKDQLKAERKQAKEEYKAKKAAQKAAKNNSNSETRAFLSKLKFWSKHKQQNSLTQ